MHVGAMLADGGDEEAPHSHQEGTFVVNAVVVATMAEIERVLGDAEEVYRVDALRFEN